MQKLKEGNGELLIKGQAKKGFRLTSMTSTVAPGSKKSTCPKSVALLNQALPLSASQNRLLLSSSGAHGGTRPPVLEMPGNRTKRKKASIFCPLKFHVMH